MKKLWMRIVCWWSEYCPKHDHDFRAGACYECAQEQKAKRADKLAQLKQRHGELAER